jgi:hypothetical protein
MSADLPRAPRNTGPIELRDLGPNGRPLGTAADCHDGSLWQLHRGELVRQTSSNEVNSAVMLLLGALFRMHAREDYDVYADVYCELIDRDGSLSLRAPDVVLAKSVQRLKDGPFQGIPVLAIEIRATQSKRQLEEKVNLYLEHDWPLIWLLHADRQEVEVVTPGSASVAYPKGTEVPLIPALDKYELKRIPVAALFDKEKFFTLNDGWVRAHERRRTIFAVLGARKLVVSEAVEQRIASEKDLTVLDDWLGLAATVPSSEAFAQALDRAL